MVKPGDIPATVVQAARAATETARPAADRHIPELRVRAPAGASRAQLTAAVRQAIAAALADKR
jgi:hypothetical protein